MSARSAGSESVAAVLAKSDALKHVSKRPLNVGFNGSA